jgi:hypothetical protein
MNFDLAFALQRKRVGERGRRAIFSSLSLSRSLRKNQTTARALRPIAPRLLLSLLLLLLLLLLDF